MVITGTRYKHELIKDKIFDVIIIGSGLSALSMGSYLAQNKKRVLLLEKHYTAGGFTHMFKRKEYMWDVGVHYVGEVHRKDSLFQKLFHFISGGNLKWAPLDDVYDHIFIGEKHYALRAGVQNFKNELFKSFPKPVDQEAINHYLNLCFKVNRAATWYYLNKTLPPVLRKLTRPILGRTFRKYAAQTTLEVMHQFTRNKELIAVLCAQYGDYGAPPKKSSFVVQALVTKHFLAGGNYPVGGAVNFAATIIPVIEENNGLVLTHAGVKEVIVEHNQAIGVLLENGDKIYATKVVSSAGVHKTFQDLLPKEHKISLKLDKKSTELPASIGHLCLYIGLKGNADNLALPKANYWIYPHNDYDLALDEFCADPQAALPLTYISFPGAKDPHWRANHPEHTTIEMITFAPWEWFEKWQDTKWHKRGQSYDEFKEFLTHKLLEKLYKHVPTTQGHVDYLELSTPLSTKHFCSYKKGEIYGLDHTPARFMADFLTPQTPIKNLYMTGQDIVTVGIASSALSGILTVSAMEKTNALGAIMKYQIKNEFNEFNVG